MIGPGVYVLVELALDKHAERLCRKEQGLSCEDILPDEANLWFVYRDEAHFNEAGIQRLSNVIIKNCVHNA